MYYQTDFMLFLSVQQLTTNTHGRHVNVTHGSNEEVQNNNNNETIEKLMEENRQLNDEMQPMPRQRHSDDNNEDLQRLQRQQEQQLQEQRLKQRLEEVLRQ
ncbi:uncharacterized protein LOC128668676 isoform X2 [Microplitis demolitor]|uniref:uncharacterized protein LOC128668676 isoform X2 n=1 Tax=Microplitis demolitor TaxID=69319 RepID=UPI00235B7076|nr:uncharacterized protein LOC128668676 isoform X2 [Microplitis demolitor]